MADNHNYRKEDDEDDDELLTQDNNNVNKDDEAMLYGKWDSKGSVISFQNIEYTINEPQSCACLKPPKPKKILENLTGTLKPGMNGIMGPTGSGKTSLLDVLAGRKDPRFKSGIVLVDGDVQPANFKCISGYVQQMDVLAGFMTVKENLNFAATLKLKKGTPSDQRSRRVDELINQLGLKTCADTYIGNEFIRGVSGGEKKRVAIGMALVNKPSVLFLDEPTTGLDASTAFSVMNLLSRLAVSGKTIIFSIHQPRYSIFKMIDFLVLLDKGKMIFQGNRNEIVPYFESFGYQIEANNNPADFVLDVITGDEEPVERSIEKDHLDTELPKKFASSELNQRILKEVSEVVAENSSRIVPSTTFSFDESFEASFFMQLVALSKRSLSNIIRNPSALIGQVFITALMGLIIGAIYFQLKDDYYTSIFNRMGVFFFLTTNLMFSNMSALEVFINDRILFINENASGYYRTSSFFLTKIVFDILVMRIFPVAILGCVTYWMIGLDPDPIKFLEYLLNMFLASITAASVILFASATFSVLALCNLAASLSFVIMIIFSGMIINVTTIGPWFSWLQYLSVIRYTLSIFLVIELKDRKFCSSVENTTLCAYGNDYLTSSDIGYETSWDLWSLYLFNFIIYFVVTFLTYIQLRRTNKYK